LKKIKVRKDENEQLKTQIEEAFERIDELNTHHANCSTKAKPIEKKVS
jgi:hypothetical protein